MKGQKFHIKDDEALTQEILKDIREVRTMSRANFAGRLELAFLPYSGGFYDQPAVLMDKIIFILDALNEAIRDKQEEEKEK